MERAAAEREAIRLWRTLPLQDRLDISQASAFARMIAPTLDFDAPEARVPAIEAWLLKDLARTDTSALVGTTIDVSTDRRLAVPGWPQREGASALAFVISLLVLVARRPDIVTNAMLWAEDGAVWFADAYNRGAWAPLFEAYGGYLQLFPRAVFGLAQLLPLMWVPLFGVWVALIVRAAFSALIFSSRFSWIDWRAKVAVCAYFLLMPNLADVHANVTNTHWYLGIYLLAVILADPPRTAGWKIHDWAALVAAGASGPMVLFALPALAFRLGTQRNTPSARWAFAGGALALAVLQLGVFVITARGSGPWVKPDQDLLSFIQLLGGRVFVGFLTPARWAIALAPPMLSIPIALVGIGLTLAVLLRGNWRTRSLAVLPVLVLAVAVWTPLLLPLSTQWVPIPMLSEQGIFVVASLAWAATLLSFAAIYLPQLTNAGLAAVIAAGGFLVLFDFALPAVPGPAFSPEADLVEAASPGTLVTVEIAPPGWEMELVKK